MKYLYEAIIEPAGSFFEARFPDFGIVTQRVAACESRCPGFEAMAEGFGQSASL